MATYVGALGFSAKAIVIFRAPMTGVQVGVVGFSDRFKDAHLPSFLKAYKELNFDIIAVSDIWKKKREDGRDWLAKQLDHPIRACMNTMSCML